MDETYYEDYLKKESVKGKWQSYWVRLGSTGLFFFHSDQESTEAIEVINITSNTRCVPTKRQTYSFRFLLLTDNNSYKFKCDSPIERYRWIYMIDLAANGKPVEIPPHYIPATYYRDQNSDTTPKGSHATKKVEACQEKFGKCETRGSSRKSIAFFGRLSSRRKKNNRKQPTCAPHEAISLQVAPSNNNSNEEAFNRQSKDAKLSLNFAENLAFSAD